MQMRLDKNGIKTYRPKILVDKRSKDNVHVKNSIEKRNEIVETEDEWPLFSSPYP